MTFCKNQKLTRGDESVRSIDLLKSSSILFRIRFARTGYILSCNWKRKESIQDSGKNTGYDIPIRMILYNMCSAPDELKFQSADFTNLIELVDL